MTCAYYNEFDPGKAEWIRELMKAGVIAQGDVDERPIQLVRADDLRGYTQCHFFAGVAVWSYALRLAGWPDDRPVWTGSCPCQGFSAAGKGEGFDDPRHLWPHWVRLIRECRPPIVVGEQSDKAVGFGWIDLVQHEMEAEGYAVGKAVYPACGAGAAHIRQRLYFGAARLADAEHAERRAEHTEYGGGLRGSVGGCGADRVGDATISERRPLNGESRAGAGWQIETGRSGVSGPVNGFWAGADWVLTRPQRVGDAPSLRPIERRPQPLPDGSAADLGRVRHPGFPLAQGQEARILRLKGYGDAIHAGQAEAFVEAFMRSTR